jgi:VanZ family protein
LEPFLTSQEIVSQFPDFDLPFWWGFSQGLCAIQNFTKRVKINRSIDYVFINFIYAIFVELLKLFRVARNA